MLHFCAKSLVLDGWVGGWMGGSKRQFKDCLQQSKIGFTCAAGFPELTNEGPANSMLEPCLKETLLFRVEPNALFLKIRKIQLQ